MRLGNGGNFLKSWSQETSWLEALENSLAEMGVAIVVTRQDLIRRLSPIIGKSMGLFPGAIISIEGKIETWLKDRSALDVEQKFKEELKQSRLNRLSDPNDIPGPHRSEFNCLHSVNKMEASSCSTGEQKSPSDFNYSFACNFKKTRFWKRSYFTS